MAPPAAAGPSGSASAIAPEPLHREEAAKRRCRPSARGAGAWARVLSMGVQGAVMTAALALFLLFAFAACLLMMALVFTARAFRRRDSRRYYAFPDLEPSPPLPTLRPAGLAPAQISRLPCFESPGSSPPQTCAVCLEASRAAGERWRALPPCGHKFHAACVDPWLLLSPACPVCRATVDAPETGADCESPHQDAAFADPHPIQVL